jgi:acetyl-CoA synthetase
VAKAYIVPRSSTLRPAEAELQEFVRERLSRHEYPRAVQFTDALPKTPAGKVNRKVLRDREAAERAQRPQ